MHIKYMFIVQRCGFTPAAAGGVLHCECGFSDRPSDGKRGHCPIERVCVLRGVLRDATEAFLAELDAYTLADLIKPRRQLSSLLVLHQHAALGW